MRNYASLIIILLMMNNGPLQAETEDKKGPPEWLTAHTAFLTQGSGCWQTSNAEYQSENETIDTYYNEWKTGIGGATHVQGRLYGKTGEQASPDFWEFLSYWDGKSGKAVTLQFGQNGIVGDGSMWQVSDGKFMQEQVFSLLDGRTWKTRHDLEEAEDSFITTSLDWEDDQWKQQRSYIWHRCNQGG